jgi:hypothetical protein
MKRKIIILTILVTVLFAFTGCMGVSHLAHSTEAENPKTIETNGIIQANQNTQASVQDTTKVYTCSMHPEVISNKPGNCPKCGMELILQTSKPGNHKMGMMGMMHGGNHHSNAWMYVVGGAMMIGMMAIMIF